MVCIPICLNVDSESGLKGLFRGRPSLSEFVEMHPEYDLILEEELYSFG